MATTTLKHIKGSELPKSLQNRFRVKPHQLLKITVEIEEDEEYDLENLGDALIKSFEEIIAHKQGKLDFPPAL